MDPVPRLGDQVCFLLYVAQRSVTQRYRPMLDPMGLTYPQYLVMMALWEHGAIPVKELGSTLQLDSSTLSPLLKRMEQTGLLTRTRRADDERSVLVEPTEHGVSLQDQARRIPRELACSIGLPFDELRALREALKRLTTALSTEEVL